MICKIQLVTKMHFNNRIYWLGIVFSVLFMPMELHAATLPNCITNYGIDSKMHCDKIHFTRNKFWLAREIISVISMRPYIPVNAYISYDGIKNCIWIFYRNIYLSRDRIYVFRFNMRFLIILCTFQESLLDQLIVKSKYVEKLSCYLVKPRLKSWLQTHVIVYKNRTLIINISFSLRISMLVASGNNQKFWGALACLTFLH